MSRIATNLQGIERALLNRVAEANAAATTSALRLATMQKINFPSDDPAGFVTLSRFQGDLLHARTLMDNVTAATAVLSPAQAAIGEIRSQLDTIRAELVKDENQTLTADERVAAQATIDNALTEINNLAGTQAGGRRLLDGSAEYWVSGRNASQESDIDVQARPSSASQTISGEVLTSATQATRTYTGASGKTTAAATFTLSGDRGSASITVGNNQNLSEVATTVNNHSHLTGVTAAAVGDTLTFTSVDAGSGATAAIAVTSGTFTVAGSGTGTSGTAQINGKTYTGLSTDGNRYLVADNGLVAEVQFRSGFTGTFDTLTVSGSAVSFQLNDNPARPATIALPGAKTSQLGGVSGTLDDIASGGAAAGLNTNTAQAIRIVDEAISQVDKIEAKLEGFTTSSVSTASAYLAKLEKSLQTSIDSIDLVDETEETDRLTFYEGLAQNGMSSITILNQQRAAVVQLLKQAAGLI